MVARPGTYQVSFNAGELAPELHGNTGLKQYYAGATIARNVEPVPQGGFDLLPRSRFLGFGRRALSSAWTAGASTSASVSAVGEVMTWTFPGPISVSALDVDGLSASSLVALGIAQFELLTAGGYVALGGPFPLPLAPDVADRRVAAAPGAPILATGLRVTLLSAPPVSLTVSIGGLTAYTEAASGVPVVRMASFTVSRQEAYIAVLTPGHVDFWRDGEFAGSVAFPYSADQLPEIRQVQRAETMLLFHDGSVSRRILRHGADFNWSISEIPWTHIPDVDYGGDYVDTPEKWTVYLRWLSTLSAYSIGFVISVDGEETPSLNLVDAGGGTLDATASAAAIKAAVEALASVEPGITVTMGALTSGAISFTIEFTGDDNSGNQYEVTGRIVTTIDGSVNTSRLVKGDPGGEALFSETRGYAAAGTFYQDRLFTGGFLAKASAFAASRTGEYFDLNIDLQNAAGALLLNLDTDGAEKIIHFARGRHLVIFTTDAEYYISDRAISRLAPPNTVRSSAYGASARVPIVEQEGSLLYLSREETIVYAATYDDVLQAYDSEPLSLLSSHLIVGICGAALQASARATDAQRYFLPRDDGVMVVGLLIRNQEVSPFVRWETDGAVRAVAVDGVNRPHLAVERQVGGAARLCIEMLDEDLVLDCAVSFDFGGPVSLVSGLSMHEGSQVWAKADGYYVGPFTVSGGAITLPDAASAVTVGRWMRPIVKTMPLVRDVAPHTVLKRPCRAHTVQLDLIETESLAVGANGQPAREQALYRAGNPVDQPLAPYTGEKIISGLTGFSPDGIVEITQLRPGRLQVRNMTIQARV